MKLLSEHSEKTVLITFHSFTTQELFRNVK